MSAAIDEPRDKERDLRDVGNHDQCDQADRQIREHADDDILHLCARDRLRDKQVEAEGRREHADGNVCDHHDAEMHQIDAQ